MDNVVIDTSVIVKWFRFAEDEDYVSEAHSLRDTYLQGEILINIPELLVIEFANLLKYSKKLKLEDAKKAFQSLTDLGLEVIPLSPEIFNRSLILAFEYDITVYDSLFVGLSEEIKADFITSEKLLYKKIKPLPNIYFLGDIRI
jgi:predicted nucleic acid-binding protein